MHKLFHARARSLIYERRDFSDFSLDVVRNAINEITAAALSSVSVGVDFSNLPSDAADITFLPGHALRFEVPAEFESPERRTYFTNRWLCTWRLFAEVKRRHPELTGQCRLWLDDVPSGPGLAFCGNSVGNLLIPDSLYFESDGYAELREKVRARWMPWTLRADTVFWRGASTGSRVALRVGRWQDLPRFRLCLSAQRMPRADLFDVGLSQVVQVSDPSELTGIEAADILRDEVQAIDFMNYRYAIDIDGNTCSWSGLITKLIMGITTIKVDSELGYRQWFYDRLIPWSNFVPLSASMSELGDIAEWLVTHPEEAFSIAQGGAALGDELTMAKAFDDLVPRIARHVATGAGPRGNGHNMIRHVGTDVRQAELTGTELARERNGTKSAEQIVAAHWSEMAQRAPTMYSWTDSPLVMRHINRTISGDPDVGWLAYACRKYLLKDGRGVARGLSIGCGSGALERQVRQMGACDRVDGFDVAPGAIEEAQRAAAAEGIDGIRYVVANVDELRLDDQTYDVVFASCSIHHLERLEQLFANVRRWLKPGGLLITVEYVGANQFQFSDKAMRIINDLLTVLPPSCRERSSAPGDYVTQFQKNTVEHMNAVDPSEAIRSADILPLLEATFTILERKDYGGTVLHMLLQDIVHNFEDGSRERAGILNLLLYFETLLVHEGVIASDFCLVVATPPALS